MPEALLASEAPVVIDAGRTWSRRDLNREVDLLAARLAESGVRPGHRVAWTMRNRAEVLVVALACRRVGALVVPLSYRATAAEIRRMLAASQPELVVVETATRPEVAAAGWHRVIDVDDLPKRRDGVAVAAAPSVDRLGAGASLLFTSGTTGRPKAALRTRGDAVLAEAIADGLGFGSESRYLAAGPLYHSGPWTCGLITLARGGLVALQRRLEPSDWLAFARAQRISATFVTPTQLRRLVDAVERGSPPPSTLVNVVVSGEPFPGELRHRAVAAFGQCVIECYGCTELGPLTYVPADQLLTRPDSSGRPFPGVQVAAFDGAQRLPAGEVGLLRAITPLAFEGYEEGAAGSVDGSGAGWATVGDMGRVDAEGFVTLVGRADDMVISGGVNVHPADVEAVLVRHPDIRQCAVFGLPDPHWGEVVCAAVVATRPVELADLRRWLSGRLADDKRPRRVFTTDHLPTTPSGKVSRRELRARYRQ